MCGKVFRGPCNEFRVIPKTADSGIAGTAEGSPNVPRLMIMIDISRDAAADFTRITQ